MRTAVIRLLCCLAMLAASVHADDLRVALKLRGPDAAACGGKIAADGVSVAVDASGSAVVTADRTMRLELVSERCWAAPLLVERGAGGRSLEMQAWPLAQLVGRFAEAKELPKRLEVSLRSAPQPAGTRIVPPATVSCTIRERTWRCPVPAVPLDVKLIPDGFAPVYVWAVAATFAKPHDAGAIELRRGASVSGWVTAPNGDPPKGSVAVELRPQVFESAREPSGRTATRIVTATTNERGFFQLRDVPPGVYDVVATARGWSPAQAEGVKVIEARELVVDRPIALRPLARLEVWIDPPLGADQQPWVLALDRKQPRSQFIEPVTRGVASADGSWTHDGLESGHYALAIRSNAGATMQTLPVDVTPDAPPVAIRLPLVQVRGRVSAGAESVAATLDFETTSGGHVSLRSDDDGRFSGTLPSEGKYSVRVKPREGGGYLVRRGIDVRRAEGASYARVDLELGNGHVTGKVVDEQGHPVSVDVMLLRNGRPEAHAATGAEGEFQMRGIDPGAVELRATNSSGDTGLVPFRVSEATGASANLVLRRPDRVRGAIFTAAGEPLAGALIRYFSPTLPTRGEVVSDPAGEFEIPVPRGTALLTIAVLAPGEPIKVAVMPAGSQEVQRIALAASVGTIFVPMTRQTPSPWLQAPGATPFPMTQLLFPRDGSAFPRGVRPDGMSIEIEPGVYSVCSDPRNAAPLCKTVQVAPGSETRLEAPAPMAATTGG